jgi:segregation and condensation protein B
MEDIEKKSLVEALLFVSGEPVSLSTLKNITELPENEIKQLIGNLITEYKEKNGGLHVVCY